MGLLILCRPPGLMIAFFGSLALLIYKRDNLKRDLIIPNAVALLVILPWVLRCSLLFGAFVPITSNGGQTFWISWVRKEHFKSSEIEDGFYRHATPKIREAIRNMNEVEVSTHIKNETFDRVINQPDRFFKILGEHFTDTIRLMAKGSQKNKSLLLYAAALYLIMLYGLTLAACWQSPKARRLVGVVFLAFFLTHIISVCHLRHRSALIDASCAIAV